jgi:hypothetical protein
MTPHLRETELSGHGSRESFFSKGFHTGIDPSWINVPDPLLLTTFFLYQNNEKSTILFHPL